MKFNDIWYISDTAFECYSWKKTFAWFPKTTLSNKRIWLKTIYKRKIRCIAKMTSTCNPVVDVVQYGTPFDMMANKYDKFFKRNQNYMFY